MCTAASVYVGTVGVLGKLYTVIKPLKQICLMGFHRVLGGIRHKKALFFESYRSHARTLTHAYTEFGEVTHFQAGFPISALTGPRKKTARDCAIHLFIFRKRNKK